MAVHSPLVGKRVAVCGTSRSDLNGCKGKAINYNDEKGRYTIRLDSGAEVALKPDNLQQVQDGQSATTTSSNAALGSDVFGNMSWQTVVFVGLGLVFLYSQLSGGGGGGAGGFSGSGLFSGDEDAEYDDKDVGYLTGKVHEVTTLDQLRGVLAHHADNTGLPVVVDFFSHSCGPCRMIAPTFKRLAGDYKGQVVFLKVDVNRNYEASSACGVRGMPTFQFYINKKRVFQFSGADERSLRQYTTEVADRTEKAGTFVGMEVTGQALRKFYDEHDAGKAKEAARLAEKYAHKTAQLMRVCKQKYGQMPEVSPRQGKEKAGKLKTSDASVKPRSLRELTLDELNAEMQELQAEFQRRGADAPAEKREEDEDTDIGFLNASQVAEEGVHKVVIIGGGPAGLSAATYAARAGLKPLVVAPSFGGQLLGKGVDVENYPGVMGEHATGRGLVELMRRQAASFEARFVDTAVLGVDFQERPLKIRVNHTDQAILAHAVILATGAESRWLHVEGEHEFRGRGVSACATCDGFLFRDKEVAVVGGGDTAMEDALHLARTSSKVTVIHRRDRFRASKLLSDRVLSHKSIQVQWNTTVESFHGGEELSHVSVVSQGAKKRVEASAVFVAIGHDPQTGFLKGQAELDAAGYVILKRSTETSVPGVFAAGDIADHTYRQAITASGTGAAAALDAEKFLNELA